MSPKIFNRLAFTTLTSTRSFLLSNTRRKFNTASKSIGSSTLGTIKKAPSGLKYLGLAGALGLGGLISYAASRPTSYVPYDTRLTMSTLGGATFAQQVRNRIMKTYSYLTGSIFLTGATAFLLFSRGVGYRIFTMNPWIYGLGTMFATWVSIGATMSIDYHHSPVAKHVAWGVTNGLIGFSILGLSMLAGGQIVRQAALITGVIVGSMSSVAMVAPNDQFLRMGPYLGVGLGVVIAASLGGMFFPASSLLMNVSLYGGLGLFGLFTAHDAQRVLHDAQIAPKFDPISEQMGLYLDSINIFVRVVQILMMQQNRRK